MRDIYESKHGIVILGYLNPNGYKHYNRIFSPGGVIGALNARDYKDPLKVIVRKSGCKGNP